MEEVILVNNKDHEVGRMEKLEAHKKGLLHRAFSVFVFNNKDELMLQKRADSKYHSGGLWTNTVCSHPRPGESITDAAHRRLIEEMGFDAALVTKFSFLYRAEIGDLVEHELDHVLFGFYNDTPKLNLKEASEWKYLNLDDISMDIHHHPENYTAWFKLIFEKVKTEYKKNEYL